MTWFIPLSLALVACGDPRIPDDALWVYDDADLLGATASGALVTRDKHTFALDAYGYERWQIDGDRFAASPTGVYRYTFTDTGISLLEIDAGGSPGAATNWTIDDPVYSFEQLHVSRGAHRLGVAWGWGAVIGDPAATTATYYDRANVVFGRDEHVVIVDNEHATETTLDGAAETSTPLSGFASVVAVANDGAAIVADGRSVARLHDGRVAWRTTLDNVYELAVNDRDQIIGLDTNGLIWLSPDGAELARLPCECEHMELGHQLYVTTRTGAIFALEAVR